MKKKALVENVTAWTADNDKADVDEQQLAIDLMKAGCSMSMVNAQLGKVLVSLGLKDDPSLLRIEIEVAVDKEMDDYTNICEMDYTDIDEFIDTVAANGDYDPKAVLKALKKQCKKLDIALPAKPKLGKVKQGIVDYFVSTPQSECSIKSLAEYLYYNNCCNATATETAEEAALRASRMSFTFANLLVNIS